jgi:hypothetical protein
MASTVVLKSSENSAEPVASWLHTVLVLAIGRLFSRQLL